jgi:hypothetical protein
MDPRHPTQEPTLRQRKSALLEAAQAAIADQRAKQGVREPPEDSGRGHALRVALGLLLLAGSTLLIMRPSWLAGPRLPTETPAVRAASATLALVEAVSQIRAYRQIRGVLPRSLGEAGVENPAIGYRVRGGTEFEVHLRAGDSTVVVSSTDSLKPRVVTAILTLQRRT